MFRGARVTRRLRFVIGFTLVFGPLALAEQRGVLDDPAGYVNLLAEKRVDAPIVATVEWNKNAHPINWVYSRRGATTHSPFPKFARSARLPF